MPSPSPSPTTSTQHPEQDIQLGSVALLHPLLQQGIAQRDDSVVSIKEIVKRILPLLQSERDVRLTTRIHSALLFALLLAITPSSLPEQVTAAVADTIQSLLHQPAASMSSMEGGRRGGGGGG